MNSTAARAGSRALACGDACASMRRHADTYTLGPMARKRPAPSAASAASKGAAKRDDQAQERFGPLAVERHRKDDGRALILYTHVEREHA
jgi:hypothetical protein